MSEKHYPCIGGGFNRIIFDGDNSVWVPEYENAKLKAENEKLRALVRGLDYCSEEMNYSDCEKCPLGDDDESLRPTCVRMMEELGIKREEI